MHNIQEQLLELSKKNNLARLSLREMAKAIGLPNESPQKIKHHLIQLEKKGFLRIDRIKGVMDSTSLTPGWAKGLLKKANKLFSIPIIGTANCGPATIFAEQNFQGFLRVSNKLIHRSQPTGLYAIKADGLSMNRAEINGKRIEDGDLVIIDSNDKNVSTGDVVLAIIDDKATIKRLIVDEPNKQIVLMADSSYDYAPIHLHSDDDFSVSGKIIEIIKKPSY
ncbi:MAG: S24 family peptidase [Candidatus Paceibacterota bacterium]|jgi:repressor LexA